MLHLNDREISAAIIESCRSGDRDSFRVLYDMHKDQVYSISLYFFRGDDCNLERIDACCVTRRPSRSAPRPVIDDRLHGLRVELAIHFSMAPMLKTMHSPEPIKCRSQIESSYSRPSRKFLF